MSFVKFFSSFIFALVIAISVKCTSSSSENQSFEMLYYANLNGSIENCKCGDPPLGGLDRIATIIENYRKKNPNIVVIDGGDTFNSYPFQELNEAIVKSYEIINPDVWVIAEQEFLEGEKFLTTAFKRNISKNILMSNYALAGLKSQKKVTFESSFKRQVVIQSYVSAIVFPEPLRNTLSIDNNFLISLKDLPVNSFNILIFHGSENKLKENQKYFTNVDLILTAHQQNSDINLQANPPVIGGSTDGENIMYISLQKSADSINITAKRIPVEIEIEQNKKVNSYISAYLTKVIN